MSTRWVCLVVALSAAVATADPFLGRVTPVQTTFRNGAPGGEQDGLVLGANDAGVLAAWRDSRRNQRQLADLYVTSLTSDGTVRNPSGAPVVLDRFGVGSLDLACTHGTCLLTWLDDELGARAQRLDELGAPVGQPITLHTNAAYGAAVVAASAGSFFVVWPEGDELVVARVALDGTLAPAVVNDVRDATQVVEWDVAASGSRRLVVWSTRDPLDGGEVTEAAELGSDGVLGPHAVVLPQVAPWLQLTGGSNDWLLSWHALSNPSFGPAQALRLGDAGVPLDPVPLVLSPSPLARSHTAAFDGTRYVVAWYQDDTPAADLIGADVDPATGAISARAFVSDRQSREQPVLLDGPGGLWAGWAEMHYYYRQLDLRLGPLRDGGLDGPLLTVTGETHFRPRSLAVPGGALATSTTYAGSLDVDFRVELTPLDAVGVPSGPTSRLFEVFDGNLSASLAFDGQQVVAAWRSWPELGVRGFSTTGAALTPRSLLATDFYEGKEVTVVPGATPAVAWSHFVGGPAGTQSFLSRLDAGVAVDVPPIPIAPVDFEDVAAIPLSDAVLFAVARQPDGLATGRVSSSGAVSFGQPLPGTAGVRPSQLSLAGDDSGALLVWSDAANFEVNLSFQRLSATGAPLGPVRTLFSRADAPWSRNYTVPRFGLGWTGVEWVVVFEVHAPDGGTQLDLWVARISPDGTVQPLRVLSADPESEEAPSLTTLSVGRLLLSYVEYEPLPGADTMRQRTRLLASVVDGAQCAAALECRAGSCVRGVCCSPDDGGCTNPHQLDGGVAPLEDGGTLGRRAHAVGCACAEASVAQLAWLTLLVLGRRPPRRRC